MCFIKIDIFTECMKKQLFINVNRYQLFIQGKVFITHVLQLLNSEVCIMPKTSQYPMAFKVQFVTQPAPLVLKLLSRTETRLPHL